VPLNLFFFFLKNTCWDKVILIWSITLNTIYKSYSSYLVQLFVKIIHLT